MSFLSRLTEKLPFGKKSDQQPNLSAPGPSEVHPQVPPMAQGETVEDQQARIAHLENLRSQSTTGQEGSFQTPPSPGELGQFTRGETMESQKPPEASMSNEELTNQLNSQVDSPPAETPAPTVQTPTLGAEATNENPTTTPFSQNSQVETPATSSAPSVDTAPVSEPDSPEKAA